MPKASPPKPAKAKAEPSTDEGYPQSPEPPAGKHGAPKAMTTTGTPIKTEELVLPTIRAICRQWIGRAEAQGLTKRERDIRCVEFFAGAATALSEIDHPEANALTAATAFLICTRGHKEVEQLAKLRTYDEAVASGILVGEA